MITMPNQWPHDDNAALIAFYGQPLSRVFALNLIPIIPPWRMLYKDDNGKVSPINHFVIHRKCHDSLAAVMSALWAYYNQDQGMIDATGLQWYGGCYSPRDVRGTISKISCHAFAAAIDLDPEHEPMNRTHLSRWPPVVLRSFAAEGWFWGGNFKTRQDPMHWQCAHE